MRINFKKNSKALFEGVLSTLRTALEVFVISNRLIARINFICHHILTKYKDMYIYFCIIKRHYFVNLTSFLRPNQVPLNAEITNENGIASPKTFL